MKKPISSLAVGVCLLALSAGVAFADNLHNPVITGNFAPAGSGGSPGQTGSNAIANCAGTASTVTNGMLVAGSGNLGSGLTGSTTLAAKSNTGVGSPIGSNANSKEYAGNPGNPATNPIAHAQYDNSCAQFQLHNSQLP